jgi:hypothetical protein
MSKSLNGHAADEGSSKLVGHSSNVSNALEQAVSGMFIRFERRSCTLQTLITRIKKIAHFAQPQPF